MCKEYVNDVWTLVFSEKDKKTEFSGHLQCVDKLENKAKAAKNLNAKTLEKILKEIGIIEK
jgi:hypothetical protein